MVSEVKLQYGIVQYVAAAATARHSSLKCSGEVEAIRTQVEALEIIPGFLRLSIKWHTCHSLLFSVFTKSRMATL